MAIITAMATNSEHRAGHSLSKANAVDTARRCIALRTLFATSQAEFCRAVGIAQNTWNQYEHGRRPSLDMALQLRTHTGVSLDWLYLGDNSGLGTRLTLDLARLLADQPPPRAPSGKPAEVKRRA